MPMLSSMRLDLARRDDACGSCRSIAAKRFSVSSMRVPGRAAHVELDQAGVDGREEVAADEREERRATPRRSATKPPTTSARCASAQREPAAVDVAQPLEAAVERARRSAPSGRVVRRAPSRACSASLREQVAHQRRHQRARQEVRRQHREDDRHRQRHEQRLRRAGDERDRHEHDADAQRRDERRHRDLLRAVEDRADERLAAAPGCGGCSRSRPSRRRRGCRPRAPCPPSVITFSVWPSAREHDDRDQDRERDRDRRRSACCASSRGTAGSSAPSAPRRCAASLTTPSTAARTKSDWSKSSVDLELLAAAVASVAGSMLADARRRRRACDASPFFRIDISTERRPSTWTMLVCGA